MMSSDGMGCRDQQPRVEVRTLADEFRLVEDLARGRRVYLKLGTQGTDLDVVKGASGALEAVDGLQSEVAVRPIYEGVPEPAHIARSASNRVACFRTTRAIFRGCWNSTRLRGPSPHAATVERWALKPAIIAQAGAPPRLK